MATYRFHMDCPGCGSRWSQSRSGLIFTSYNDNGFTRVAQSEYHIQLQCDECGFELRYTGPNSHPGKGSLDSG